MMPEQNRAYLIVTPSGEPEPPPGERSLPMPILGLTDQPARLPVLGILRKGAPQPRDKKGPGEDLTYFRFASTDKPAEHAFLEVYGPEPRQLNVRRPYAATAD